LEIQVLAWDRQKDVVGYSYQYYIVYILLYMVLINQQLRNLKNKNKKETGKLA
jgi:hypothetical protein